MAKGSAHQKQSRVQLLQQKELRMKSIEMYQGKLALLREWEEAGISNDYTKQLSTSVRKLRVMLENKGVL